MPPNQTLMLDPHPTDGHSTTSKKFEEDEIDCLCYVSTATPNLDTTRFNELVNKANDFNRTENITGILFYWQTHIFQYLEGPKHSVHSLMERIKKDDRHHVTKVIQFEPTRQRRFSGWAMMRVSVNSQGIVLLVESVINLMSKIAPRATIDASSKETLFGLLNCLGEQPLKHDIETEIIGKRLIVIGASAGGITALKVMLNELSKDINASLLIVTHLAPNHKTVLHQILERECGFTVRIAEHGDLVLPGIVHLIPPNYNIEIFNGRIHVTEQLRFGNNDKTDDLKIGYLVPHPIDVLLHSCAKQYGRKVIGVILSGGGSDGTSGAKAIQEAGGIIIAQKPNSAEFPSMPQSVISEGLANRVLPPARIAQFISSIVENQSENTDSNISEEDKKVVEKIVDTLKSTSADFTKYKRMTIVNRILRRKTLLELDDLEKYHQVLSESEEEQRLLVNDLLICVTSFFRDTEAWDALNKSISIELIDLIRKESELRVWVAGCATGEEAYSLAIVLSELYANMGKPANFKVFATDLSKNSLSVAKEGVYAFSIVNSIDENLLTKYFTITSNAYQVNQSIKKKIIWADHNLINSPPFTNMHIVCCRNVIIYMNNELQKEVLRILHFALVKGGLLFLGPSESAEKLPGEFKNISRKWNIHKKKHDKKIPLRLSSGLTKQITESQQPPGARQVKRIMKNEEEMYRNSLEAMCSAQKKTALIVSSSRIVELVISDSIGLLQVATGLPEARLDKLLVPSLVSTVIVNLQQLGKLEKQKMSFEKIECLDNNNNKISLNMEILSLSGNVEDHHWLVTCQEYSPQELNISESSTGGVPLSDSASSVETNQNIIGTQSIELKETRSVLFDTIEELERSKHEQQDAFQQLTTANEELQSTNEELQSVNEELYTVNFEYQSKIHELSDLNNDLDNLMQCTELNVIFVSPDMTIRRMTRQAEKTAHILPSDVGVHVSVIANKLNFPELESHLEHVMSLGKGIDCDISFDNIPNRLHVGIHPYRIDSELVQGAIITLLDLASLKTFSFSPIELESKVGDSEPALLDVEKSLSSTT